VFKKLKENRAKASAAIDARVAEYQDIPELGSDELRSAYINLRRIYDESVYPFAPEAIEYLLDKIKSSHHHIEVNTDCLVNDKADQLLRLFSNDKAFDVPRADALVETISRLIDQRDGEAEYKMEQEG
jgi:hypothetical protein